MRQQRAHGLRCRCARTGHGNHRRRIWPFTSETPLPVSRINSSSCPGPRSRNLLLSKSGRPIGRREDGAAAVSPSTPPDRSPCIRPSLLSRHYNAPVPKADSPGKVPVFFVVRLSPISGIGVGGREGGCNGDPAFVLECPRLLTHMWLPVRKDPPRRSLVGGCLARLISRYRDCGHPCC